MPKMSPEMRDRSGQTIGLPESPIESGVPEPLFGVDWSMFLIIKLGKLLRVYAVLKASSLSTILLSRASKYFIDF